MAYILESETCASTIGLLQSITASTEVDVLALTRGACFVGGYLGLAAVVVLQCVFEVPVPRYSYFFLCKAVSSFYISHHVRTAVLVRTNHWNYYKGDDITAVQYVRVLV